MRTTIVIGLFGLLLTNCSMAQKAEKEAVRKTIIAFAQAGDNNDVGKLTELLDENYRVVMNRLFGSKEVAIVPRSVYLDKIRSKEWGGDERKTDIQMITINGTTAQALVTMKGKKSTFVSLLTLVKGLADQWKLVSDVPMIQ